MQYGRFFIVFGNKNITLNFLYKNVGTNLLNDTINDTNQKQHKISRNLISLPPFPVRFALSINRQFLFSSSFDLLMKCKKAVNSDAANEPCFNSFFMKPAKCSVYFQNICPRNRNRLSCARLPSEWNFSDLFAIQSLLFANGMAARCKVPSHATTLT